MKQKNGKIYIKNVPSQVCKQCGEITYSNEVAKQLEKLVNSVRNSITEITVINYTEKVAWCFSNKFKNYNKKSVTI